MPSPRRLTVDPSQCGLYHCWSRCVRRAFLCGKDSYSGRNYEHRRAWIRDFLRELAVRFAIEVCSYSVMSNHFHVVLRTQPDWVKLWEDREVARRWLWLFPGPNARRHTEPTEEAINAMCADRRKIATCRARLADLSWFMRCLDETIARWANQEDDCTGRFWEGRFKSEKLADDGALLACMGYVDLNPVRAGMARSLEESAFTSAQDRLVACKARRQLAAAPDHPTAAQADFLARARAEARRDCWLAPLGSIQPDDQGAPSSHPAAGHSRHGPDRSASHHSTPTPILPQLTAERYLELIDWTGRQIRSGKRGRVSPQLRPLLERLDLDVEAWTDNVEAFGGLFHRLAGKLEALRAMAAATGRAWLHGKAGARRLYAAEAT